jgi:hypothetical protein
MDILSTLIDTVSNFISVPFIVSVNLISYVAIKNVEKLNKERVLQKNEKKGIVFLITILLMTVFFYLNPQTTFDILFLSALLSPYTYNFILKSLLKNLNLSYNKSDLELI